MKKIFLLLSTVFLLVSATACMINKNSGNENESTNGETQTQETEPVEPVKPVDVLQSSTVVFDFSNGSSEGEVRNEVYSSYSETISDEELINALSSMSGLDFNVTLSTVDGRLVADWAMDSTLIAGLDDREQKEDFFFYDADSLRWFMMDSLWRTLGKEEIYYTMDGGKELVFNELYPINFIPFDSPYMGSAFYSAHSDVVGDFSYIDEDYNLVLYYPNSFAQESESTNIYTKRFASRNGGASLLYYWVIPNTDGTTPENFYDSTPATIIGTEKNVVYGWGNELNQLTGEETVNAYYWLVEREWIACVAISCETEGEAFAWCSKIIEDRAVFIEERGKVAEEASVFSEGEAMNILSGALDMAEGTAIVSYGEDIINGVHCWTFAYGKDTPEKFTAEVHYAVTDYGRILVLDFSDNKYKEYK